MTPTPGGPTEPASDIRQMASIWRQMYIALTNEGFTPTETLYLIGAFIAATINANPNRRDT